MDQSHSVPDPSVDLAYGGEIDLATAPPFRRALIEAIDLSDSQETVVDLSHVSFMDSTGISVLVMAHKHAEQQGHRLVLLNPSHAVSHVLELAGLQKVFTIVAR